MGAGRTKESVGQVDVQGTVAAGWEPVRDAFLRNFEQRGSAARPSPSTGTA